MIFTCIFQKKIFRIYAVEIITITGIPAKENPKAIGKYMKKIQEIEGGLKYFTIYEEAAKKIMKN